MRDFQRLSICVISALAFCLILSGSASAEVSIILGAGGETDFIIYDNDGNDLDATIGKIRFENIEPPGFGWGATGSVNYDEGGRGYISESVTLTDCVIYNLGGIDPVDGNFAFASDGVVIDCAPMYLKGHQHGYFKQDEASGTDALQKVSVNLTATSGEDTVNVNVPCEGILCDPPTSTVSPFEFNPPDVSVPVTVAPTMLSGRLDFTLGQYDYIQYPISVVVTLSCREGVPSSSSTVLIIVIIALLLAGVLFLRRYRLNQAV